MIPPSATLTATVRTFSEGVHRQVRDLLTRVCEGIAAAHGLTARVDYRPGYPVTVNTSSEVDRVARVARGLFGADAYFTAPQPLPGSEDFSYVLEQVPGAFFGVGATVAGTDPAGAPYNHSPQARFDDAALAVGPAVLAGLAIDRLSPAGSPARPASGQRYPR